MMGYIQITCSFNHLIHLSLARHDVTESGKMIQSLDVLDTLYEPQREFRAVSY